MHLPQALPHPSLSSLAAPSTLPEPPEKGASLEEVAAAAGGGLGASGDGRDTGSSPAPKRSHAERVAALQEKVAAMELELARLQDPGATNGQAAEAAEERGTGQKSSTKLQQHALLRDLNKVRLGFLSPFLCPLTSA